MLREVVYQGLRTRRIRPTWLLQSSRSLADQPFREELDRLLESAGDAVRVIRLLSQPEADAHEGKDFDRHGRIDRALLRDLLEVEDYDQIDFAVCGPGAFTQSVYDSLRELDMAAPCSDAELLEAHRELIRLNDITDGMVYLQVTRGNPGDRVVAEGTGDSVSFDVAHAFPISDDVRQSRFRPGMRFQCTVSAVYPHESEDGNGQAPR